MATQIRFPQGPIADATGYVTLEWSEWFLNPQFMTISFSTAIGVSGGGTGLTGGTSGGVLAFTAAGTIASSGTLGLSQIVLGGGLGGVPATPVGLGTGTTVLHGNAAGAPTFGAVALTADVSGTLPVANGGTGVTSSTGTGSVVLSNSPALVTPTLGAALATSINFGQTTLNYYGEGTWTPIDSSGAGLSFSAASGTYTRIGNTAICSGNATYPVTASGATAVIGGLPFTTRNVVEAQQGVLSYTTGGGNKFEVNQNATTAQFYTAAGVGVTNVQQSGSSNFFQAIYPV